jgi:predicted metal-binding membrane protein
MDILGRLRRIRGGHWLGFYGVVLGGWVVVFAMQLPADLREAAGLYGDGFWAAFCAVTPGLAGAPVLFGMWCAMAAAMMAPTFLPTLATYDDLVQGGAAPGFAGLLSGYLAVWFGFAVLATFAQLGMAGLGLIDPLGGSTNRWLTVALLAGAGAYQFSALKEACLSKCRRPMAFFMQHWDEGPWRMGLRLGALCLGCCWALMALAFVGGTMNLAWMGAAMVLMTLEKLPDIGRVLTRPLGFALLAAASVVALK